MKAKTEENNIAHYRILEVLGIGGMGAVYKAYDEKLHRVVALKLLPPEAVTHEDRRRRFLQEARAASALNHPHILTVYEVGEASGQPFIVMEYVEGETLRQKIKTKPLQIKETLRLAIQIAGGLAKAHEQGVVHRDLKPENLMISRDGYAKILDFGLAKLVGRRSPVTADSGQKTLVQVKTEAGTIMGTINYMSPEQLLGARVDRRSDIFSFGIVLCEMATGRCPFIGENQIDTMHAILHQEPTLEINTLPSDLSRILARALAKSAKERYQKIDELLSELEALKRDLELGKTAVNPAAQTKLVLKRVMLAPKSRREIDYAKELNEAQYRAVTTTEGPLLIVAGAGTGKTRTLVYRVAHLVSQGVRPEAILLLTFTRRAALSMLARAAQLADESCQRVAGGTFHSMAHSVLRKYPELAEVRRNFTVLDGSDTEDLLDLLRSQQVRPTKERRFPRKRTICAIFSMAVNKVISLKEVIEQSYPQFATARESLEELYASFEEFKRSHHMLTYDDLLVRLRETLEKSEELRAHLSEQYRYVMVDEYQDTNKLQAQIVRMITSAHENVAVVGDESQSIYSFRGASFTNMIEFPKHYPAAKIIKLEENYRSTQPILDLANAIIGDVQVGYAKRLYSTVTEGPPPIVVRTRDENEQSRFVAQRIEELRDEGLPPQEIAVLFRASSHSFDLEVELAKHGIPFRKFGGIKFAESAHVKDALAFLRVTVNPSDTLSWFRVLKLIAHIGNATVEQILEHLGVEKKEYRTARTREALFKKLARFESRASYKDSLNRLARLLVGLAGEKSPAVQLSTVLRFYRPLLKEKYDDHPRRLRELEHLRAIAKRYKSTAELLADVALDPSDAAQQFRAGERGAVTLSTVHSAKGLEWKALFVIWMTDGWFPSARSSDEFDDLEEERRLLYVAVTRAREHLYFTYPVDAYRPSESAYLPTVSRLLETIPPSILHHATVTGAE